MADWTIEVPLDMKGSKSKSGKSGGTGGKLAAKIGDLSKNIAEGLGLAKLLGDALGGVYKLFEPILKMLSALLLIIFLPMMPLIKGIVEGIAFLIKLFSGEYGDVAKFIGKALLAILLIIIAIITGPLAAVIAAVVVAIALLWEYIVAGAKFVWEMLKELGIILWDTLLWLWEQLKKGFSLIWEGLKWVWEKLKEKWNFMIDAGKWIWENLIKKGFNNLLNAGKWIWDMIKKPFEWLKDKLSGLLGKFGFGGGSKGVQDAIIKPDGSIIQTSPSDYLIATKDPSKLGGGNINVTINNPSVRNDQDIKKIANEVSQVLQRQLTGRFSLR